MKDTPGFTDRMLLEMAKDARSNAYAPYSGFEVGAACLGGSGKAYFGCNVENASYPVGLCAERAALASAVAHGEKKVSILALAAGPKGSPALATARPCGMCLQFMTELMSSDARIIIADGDDRQVELTLKDLLPQAFGLPGRRV
jgi:cytidine deaminase